MWRTRFSLALIAVLAATPAFAGPTVIRDELVQDTAVTPTLGRGYSIATNTYQSMCLIDVVGTEPSYNFLYEFQDLTAKDVESGTFTAGIDGRKSQSGGKLPVGADVGTLTNEWKADTTRKTTTTSERHHVLVTIYVDVYYRSVDETKSKMSPAATKILGSKDIPGFFDACGMYYVRSISRRASVISLFTFTSDDVDSANDFKASLKSTIRGFTMPTKDDSNVTKVEIDNTVTAGISSTSKKTVTDLQISTMAVGLGKSASTELVAYDLETFRKSVQSAFKATQPQDVGLVTSIEVVPWIENTEFQSLNTLEPITVPMLDDKGVPVMDLTDPAKPVPKTKTIMPYEQKRTLNLNAEFLADLDRAARAKLNVYYKSKMCRSQLNIDHMSMSRDGKWSFKQLGTRAAPRGTTGELWIASNRDPGEEHWMQLKTLDGLMSESVLQRLWMEYDSFMYGGTSAELGDIQNDPGERAKLARAILLGTRPEVGYPRDIFPGAGRCVSDLFAAGITSKSFRTVPTCQRIEETFAVVSGQQIDDYCMLRLTGRVPTTPPATP
jgi:hypothetical protein